MLFNAWCRARSNASSDSASDWPFWLKLASVVSYQLHIKEASTFWPRWVAAALAHIRWPGRVHGIMVTAGNVHHGVSCLIHTRV